MFNCGGDDRVAVGLGFESGKNGGGVGFGTARGEDDFRIVFGAEQLLHLAARLLERLAHFAAKGVDRRCVAEMLRKEWKHGFHHDGINACGGVVVQVDRSIHGKFFLLVVGATGWKIQNLGFDRHMR